MRRLLVIRGLAISLCASAFLAVSAPGAALADLGGQYPVDGLDVASWQHPGGAAIDWARVRAAHVDFATVKATEGSSVDDTAYTNPYFDADLGGARAQGLAAAPYHFYLGRTEGTGVAQADHFIAVVRAAGYTGHRPNDLPPILDLEWDWKGGCPPHGTVDDVRAFLDRVEAAFGRHPMIYTNHTFMAGCMAATPALAGYPLQVASYDVDTPTLPAGWSTWRMWQWT